MTIGWSIAVGDRPEVAVDGSDGEFTDPEVPQRGDDLSVEAVPVEPKGAGERLLFSISFHQASASAVTVVAGVSVEFSTGRVRSLMASASARWAAFLVLPWRSIWRLRPS